MIVVMKPEATEEHIDAIVARVRAIGCKTHTIIGTERAA